MRKSISLMSFIVLRILLFSILLNTAIGYGQTEDVSIALKTDKKLFESNDLLSVKLSYSRKQLKKETNDSTFIDSYLNYKTHDNNWNKIGLKVRARGNFRRGKCHFTPLKLKIKKSAVKKTIFKGHKQLKLVLPCLNEPSKDDYVLKEHLIYKMYEIVSPYYFRSRLLDIEYSEIKRRTVKVHNFKGLLIEDNSKVAKRLKGSLGKRKYYPQALNNLDAVRFAMFQYMIGNTDFSSTYQHNSKVLFVDKKFVCIPYDFDMAGFVNTSYAVVSRIGDKKLPIEAVTQRHYMGYKRDYKFFRQVRQEFLNNKENLLKVIDANADRFINQNSYKTARKYILDFFKILANEAKFKKMTYDRALAL